jgi:hypothetical protein
VCGAGFELSLNHQQYDHMYERSGVLSHTPASASGLDAESGKSLNTSFRQLATGDGSTFHLSDMFECLCGGGGPATKVDNTREDDAGELDPPDLDPNPEPDTWLSDRAFTRRVGMVVCQKRNAGMGVASYRHPFAALFYSLLRRWSPLPPVCYRKITRAF